MNDDLHTLGKFDLIISNPPYVSGKDFETLEPELKIHEPKIALSDNSDGLSFYKRIIEVSDQILNKPGKIYFELGIDQSAQVQKYFEEINFNNIKITKDYSGIDRIICGELK
jgi:release factor glutamine methyltransferase